MLRLFHSDPHKKSNHTIENIREKLLRLSPKRKKTFVVELCQSADSLDKLIAVINKGSTKESRRERIAEAVVYLSEYMETYYAFVNPDTVASTSKDAFIKTLNPAFSWFKPVTYNIRIGDFLSALDKTDSFYVFNSEEAAVNHFKAYFKVTDGVVSDKLPPIFEVRLKKEVKENEIHVLSKNDLFPIAAKLIGFSQSNDARKNAYVDLYAEVDRQEIVYPSRYFSK